MLTLALPLLMLAATDPVRLDLDRDTARQTIVDREAGVYLGHVSTVLLDDGKTILAAYPKGHGKGPIVLKRSEDGGLTWSDRLPVPESWSTSLETPTHFKMGAGAGELEAAEEPLILFSGLYPIRAARSSDSGRTWTELAPIGDFGGIVAMGGVADLGDGEFAAFFHDDGRFFAPGGAGVPRRRPSGASGRWRPPVPDRRGDQRPAPIRCGSARPARRCARPRAP